MAVLWYESFEFNQRGVKNTWFGSNYNVSSSSRKDGSYAAFTSGTGTSYWYQTSGSPTELYGGAWIERNTGDAQGLLCFYLDDGVEAHVRTRYAAPNLYVDAYLNGSLLASGTIPTALTADFWHIEAYFKLDNTTGRFVIKVNGTTDVDFTGDTNPASATYIDYFGLETVNSNQTFIDNAFCADAWTGQLRIHTMRPTSDSETTWTKSTGSTSYTLVDEASANTTDYVYTTTDAIQEEWGTTGDFSDTAKTIVAVGVKAYAVGINGTEGVKLGLDSGGTESASAILPATTSWESHYTAVFNTDPNTAAAWANATAVNAAKPFIESDTA